MGILACYLRRRACRSPGGGNLALHARLGQGATSAQPQIPYAVFPLHAPFWLLGGLASRYTTADGAQKISVSIITVEPNRVLKSVGHHRSPAILRSPGEAKAWLRAPKQEALELLRPFPDESMGVESVPMGVKIPGNEEIILPDCLKGR